LKEQNRAMSVAAHQTLEKLKAMPWDERAETVAQLGLDLLVFHGAGKFTGAALAKFIELTTKFKAIAAAERVAAAAGKASAPITELGQQVAVVGKVAAEHGADIAEEVVETIAKNPQIIQAEGGLINAAKKVANAANKRGKDFEDLLVRKLGGRGSFRVKGKNSSREFDGAVGNIWYEAKSGRYWNMILDNPDLLNKFRERMIAGLKIASENGAKYEIYSESLIPRDIKCWLTEKGIPFKEFLEGE